MISPVALNTGIKAVSSPAKQSYKQVYRALRKKELPGAITATTLSPIRWLISLGFPLPLIMSLKHAGLLFFKGPIRFIKHLKAKAKYIANGDPTGFNPTLPLRKKLAKMGSKGKAELNAYDKAVHEIMAKLNFYEYNGNIFKLGKKIKNTIKNLQEYKDFNKGLKEKIEKDGNRNFFWKLFYKYDDKALAFKEKIATELGDLNAKYYKNVRITEVAKPDIAINTDKGNHYYVAANIYELLHKRPDMLKKLLDSEKPVDILLTKNVPILVGGAVFPGFNNLITYNNYALGMSPTIVAHELVYHLTNGKSGTIGKHLAAFTDQQKLTFDKIHKAFRKRFQDKDYTWLGRAKAWLLGKTSNGIRNYAFYNNFEFATVTIETFLKKPKALLKTEEGKKLYDLYKAFFRFDPKNYTT